MGWKGCRSNCTEKNRKKDTYPNVPAALPHIVREVAFCYGVPAQEVADTTRKNVQLLLQAPPRGWS
jgi:Tat protein secretion system quality control protein TatD with DNase activity